MDAVIKKKIADHKKWREGKGGERANLSGANLSGANLYGANLYETRCDSDTTLPDGYKLTNAGLVVKK